MYLPTQVIRGFFDHDDWLPLPTCDQIVHDQHIHVRTRYLQIVALRTIVSLFILLVARGIKTHFVMISIFGEGEKAKNQLFETIWYHFVSDHLTSPPQSDGQTEHHRSTKKQHLWLSEQWATQHNTKDSFFLLICQNEPQTTRFGMHSQECTARERSSSAKEESLYLGLRRF